MATYEIMDDGWTANGATEWTDYDLRNNPFGAEVEIDLVGRVYEVTRDEDGEPVKKLIGRECAAATLGRRGGQATGKAKSKASRENGRNGGRPKNLRIVNAAAHVHVLREPLPCSTKSAVISWLEKKFPDHIWSRSWNLARLDSEMRDEEVRLEWD